MHRIALLGFLPFAALMAVPAPTEAQERRTVTRDVGTTGVIVERPLILRVRPRSFLEPGTVVQPGELDRTTSGFAQTRSYLVSPPWHNQRDRFGEGALPDPVHGPFIGARNAFGAF